MSEMLVDVYSAPATSSRWIPSRARLPLLTLITLVLVAIFAPLLAPYNPLQPLDIVALKSLPPSLSHPFGTDPYSRDVLSRVIYGARISLSVAAIATTLTLLLGVAWGAIAGYTGGWIDGIMMRFVDACMAIPRVLIVILVVALWQGLPLWMLILVIGTTGWFNISRIVRAQVQVMRREEYILASESLGARRPAIFLKHMLPNLLPAIIAAASLELAHVVVLEAGLSYLGLGVQPPAASWGTLIYDGAGQLGTLWWISVFPGALLAITSVAAATLGDAYRRMLDPRTVLS